MKKIVSQGKMNSATSGKRTYVVVGSGGRALDFIDPIVGKYSNEGQLLAFCDVSQVRMDFHCERLEREFGYPRPATYLAKDFDRMLDELRPDVVIICTVDESHHEYIIRAVNKGCDVVCEKPITIDDEKCREILNAPGIKRQKVRIAFNVRWSAWATVIKQAIIEGKIGRITQINYEAIQDWRHGGSYFSRWHGNKANSGGLQVHKSSHHFDVVNWWLDSIPAEVFAYGDMAYYGRENAIKRGQEEWTKHERTTGVTTPKENPFHLELTSNEAGKNLYMAAEKETGYIYDRNPFRDGVDIEDTFVIAARYKSGTILSYSLNAYSPWAGYNITIIGNRGRLEFRQITKPPKMKEPVSSFQKLTYLPLFEEGEEIEIPHLEGNHDGADPLLLEQIYSLDPPMDPYGRHAGYEQGIAAAIMGIAASYSMERGVPIRIADLIDLPHEANFLHELK